MVSDELKQWYGRLPDVCDRLDQLAAKAKGRSLPDFAAQIAAACGEVRQVLDGATRASALSGLGCVLQRLNHASGMTAPADSLQEARALATLLDGLPSLALSRSRARRTTRTPTP